MCILSFTVVFILCMDKHNSIAGYYRVGCAVALKCRCYLKGTSIDSDKKGRCAKSEMRSSQTPDSFPNSGYSELRFGEAFE